jgi:hypothetical protein
VEGLGDGVLEGLHAVDGGDEEEDGEGVDDGGQGGEEGLPPHAEGAEPGEDAEDLEDPEQPQDRHAGPRGVDLARDGDCAARGGGHPRADGYIPGFGWVAGGGGRRGGQVWMKVPTTTKSNCSHRLARSGLNQDVNTFIASSTASTWRDGDESFKPNEQAAAAATIVKPDPGR